MNVKMGDAKEIEQIAICLESGTLSGQKGVYVLRSRLSRIVLKHSLLIDLCMAGLVLPR